MAKDILDYYFGSKDLAQEVEPENALLVDRQEEKTSTLDYITLSPQELGKLLSAGNGDAAKTAYLYMKATGDVTLKQAETQLGMTNQTLPAWAESLLKRLGLDGRSGTQSTV